MNDDSSLEKIRAILEIARREVNRNNGLLALEYLRGIKDGINLHAHTPEWVDYSLIAGEALLVDRSSSAGSFLLEAVEKLTGVPDPPDELRARAYERLGDFYSCVPPKKLSLAKEYFARAKEVAVGRRVAEEIDCIGLKIVRTDLQIDNDSRLQDFQTLRRVAKSANETCVTQLAAWHQHIGNLEVSTDGIRFARAMSKASEEYFRDLLRSVRMK